MLGLDYLGITNDTVFYSVFVTGSIAILARKTMKRLSFEKKAVIFITATLGLRLFFFLTAGQNEFPTGEVYAADVPAIQHPYQFAWQAPYGVLWYAITTVMTYICLPIVRVIGTIFFPSCQCLIELHYLDGHTVTIPYSYEQYLLGISMMIGYTLIALPFYWYLRKSSLLVAFFISDNFFWATTPVNVPILIFAVMGLFAKKFLPWAVIAKLPIGAPIVVWQFVGTSVSSIGHWFPHIMYGIWWIAAIVRWTSWKHAWNFQPNSMELQLLNSQVGTKTG